MGLFSRDRSLGPELSARVSTIIGSAKIASLATVGRDGASICAVFYVYLGSGRFGFKSRRASEHMRNVSRRPGASLLVFSPDSTYAAKYGIQIRGHVRACANVDEMAQVIGLYGRSFEGAGKKLSDPATMLSASTDSTFFVFQAEKVKLIDESPSANRTTPEYADFPVG